MTAKGKQHREQSLEWQIADLEQQLAVEQAAHAETMLRADQMQRSSSEHHQMFEAALTELNTERERAERLSVALQKVVIIADRCDDAGSEYWQAGLIAKAALEAAASEQGEA